MRQFILIASLFFSTLVSPAQAAGIDCTKAKTVLEKAICADPKLLKLDQEMAALYMARVAKLSVEGEHEQLKVQKEWSRFRDTVCSVTHVTKFKPISTCLLSTYRDRIRDLKNVALKIGPYLFTNIASYAATPIEINPLPIRSVLVTWSCDLKWSRSFPIEN